MDNSEQTRIPYSTFEVGNGDKVITMSVENAEWLISLAIDALDADSDWPVRQNREQLEILQRELLHRE